MSQDVRSGGAFIGPWRSLQPDQTFQSFEAELDAPAQPIEGQDISRGEAIGSERSDQNDPFGRGQSAVGYLMPACARGLVRLALGRFGRLLAS